MNIKINRGQQLFIEWPFDAPSFEGVTGEALDFSFNGKLTASFSRTIWNYVNMTGTLSKELILIKKSKKFCMVFDTYDIDFMSNGINNYEILIVGSDDNGLPITLFHDTGTVEVVG